jgi:hypothetical protein
VTGYPDDSVMSELEFKVPSGDDPETTLTINGITLDCSKSVEGTSAGDSWVVNGLTAAE